MKDIVLLFLVLAKKIFPFTNHFFEIYFFNEWSLKCYLIKKLKYSSEVNSFLRKLYNCA
jgi:hypothetical protein